MKPGSKEWHERVEEVRETALSESGWWYLSFANDDGFLGGLFIDAPDMISAIDRSHRLGLNPGGEVMCLEVPMEALVHVEKTQLRKLLTREELTSFKEDA